MATRKAKLPTQQMRAMKRLWIDPKRGTFFDVPQRNGTRDVRIPLQFIGLMERFDSPESSTVAKQGKPLECWLNQEIEWHYFKNPELYTHPVVIPYVEQGGGVWLLSHKKGALPTRSYRYRHNLSKYVNEFDKITTREKMVAFIDKLKKRRVVLILSRPGKQRTTARAVAAAAAVAAGKAATMEEAYGLKPAPRKVEFIAGRRRYSRGAGKRFEAAGLLLPRYNGIPAAPEK